LWQFPLTLIISITSSYFLVCNFQKNGRDIVKSFKRNFKPIRLCAVLLSTLLLLTATAVVVSADSPTSIALSVNIDGIISENEYDAQAVFGNGDYILLWSVVDDTIHFGIIARTTGFVGLGIDPEQRMLNADMIIGWVTDGGTVEIFDAFSTGETGPHPEDTDLGGTFDILDYDGSETDTHTILEFKRKLSTGDQYDNIIPAEGSLDIIWSLGQSDTFSLRHDDRGSGTITVDAEGIQTPGGGGICFGTILISLFSAATVVSYGFLRYWKKKNA
jgi:hypothetical protein